MKTCVMLLATLLNGLVLDAAWAADLESVHTFSIAPQKLESALIEFSKQAQLQVIGGTDTLANSDTRGVNGKLSSRDALNALLQNTEVAFNPIGTHSVQIVPSHRKSMTQNGSNSPGLMLADGAIGQDTTRESQPPQSPPLEEVVVTAQKRIERLQDVPVPVTVLNGEALADNGQLRLQDYYRKVPGLNLVLAGDASEPVIAIRGLVTGGLSNPTAGVVIDDVPYGPTVNPGEFPIAPDIDPGNLARVEVLRGPQGTLYGATNLGGLIKYVTLEPSLDAFKGRVQAGINSVSHGEEGYEFRGAVNVPVGDTLSVRANGFTVRQPGYVDNLQTGERDVNGTRSEGGRISALWRPSEAFSLKLMAGLQNSHRHGTADANPSLSGDLQQRALIGTGIYNRDSQNYTATISGKAGAVDWISISGYSVDEIETKGDVTQFYSFLAPANSGVAAPFDLRTDKFSQEIRATIPVGSRTHWLIGGFYTKEDNHSTFADVAENNVTGVALDPTVGLLLKIDQPSTYQEYAGFTNLSLDVTDRLDVQFGTRFSRNEQTFSAARSGPISHFFNTPNVPKFKGHDDAATYLLTPRLKLSSDLMLYARLASGYRPGGPNATCTITVPCKYDADRTQNYEIGIKGNLHGQWLSYDASVYYIDWKDVQLAVFVDGLGYIVNAGRAKSQGVELSAESKPSRGLTVSGWVAWNDAELTQNLSAVTGLSGHSGDVLPYSSRFSGSLSVDQDLRAGSDMIWFIGGSLSYVGERKGQFYPAIFSRETSPSYTQLDLRLGLKYGDWTANAFANNVADRRGVLRIVAAGLAQPIFTYIQPRTVGLSLSRSF